MPDNVMSAISRFGAKVRRSAAETARELPETVLLATDNIKRPCGTLFNQSPGEPDQLFCSYRAGWEHKCPYRFSSRKGFPKAGKTLKKFNKSLPPKIETAIGACFMPAS